MPQNYIWEHPQTIDFTAITSKTVTLGTFTATATSSAGLPVVLTSTTPSIVTVNGMVVTLVGGTGTASITASARGNNTFNPAPDVTRTFSVT